jgi:hypothetical protein
MEGARKVHRCAIGRGDALNAATISVVDWGRGVTDWNVPAKLRPFNDHHHLGWAAARWLQAEAE